MARLHTFVEAVERIAIDVECPLGSTGGCIRARVVRALARTQIVTIARGVLPLIWTAPVKNCAIRHRTKR